MLAPEQAAELKRQVCEAQKLANTAQALCERCCRERDALERERDGLRGTVKILREVLGESPFDNGWYERRNNVLRVTENEE